MYKRQLLESLGLDELQSVLAGLRTQFPELEITLARLDNPTLLEQLSDGRLDAAVTFDHAMEGRAGVRYEELLLEQSLFVISRDHPLARLDNIVPQALSGQMICETRAREGDGSDSYLRRLVALSLIHILPSSSGPSQAPWPTQIMIFRWLNSRI